MASSRTGERIGLIGVGLMGTALAERLLHAGFAVLGWDSSPERREALRSLGGAPAAGAGEVLATCRRVVLSLPDLRVVAAVLAEAGALDSGAVEAEASLRAGQVEGQMIVDTTTGGPDEAMEIAARLERRGVAYLDATVSGSSAQARKGDVTVMVGGSREAFDGAADILRAFTDRVFHLGPSGSGSKMKLVTNLVLGLNRAALAEGLAFAKALGIDLAQALALLRAGLAYSRIMDTKGEKMVKGDFEPQARLAQHLKDVRLILEAAERGGRELPLSEAHRRLLEAAVAAGLGYLDNSAILRAYDVAQGGNFRGGQGTSGTRTAGPHPPGPGAP